MDNFLLLFQNELVMHHYCVFVFILAFLGGVISALSPCSLGILPIIVGYIGGYDRENLKNIFIQLLFFVLGMSAVMSILGILCALGGKVFASFLGPYGILLLTSFILIMGLNLIGIIDINIPVLIKQFPQNKNNNIILYPLLIGAVFALAASPCSTPVLASIMAMASISSNVLFALCLLFAFSLGQGLIIIIAGFFTGLIKNLKSFAGFSAMFLQFCGWLLILSALYLYYKVFSVFIV